MNEGVIDSSESERLTSLHLRIWIIFVYVSEYVKLIHHQIDTCHLHTHIHNVTDQWSVCQPQSTNQPNNQQCVLCHTPCWCPVFFDINLFFLYICSILDYLLSGRLASIFFSLSFSCDIILCKF